MSYKPGRLFVSAAPALLAALAACASAAPPLLSGYDSFTLPNGMRVVALEDPSHPIVSVQVWYHVGSKNERPDRQGFAHMFEHMMFRGTDRLGPKDHFEWIRRTGGTCNAYTSFDQTVYHQTLPSSQLELAIWLEAERMAFLRIDQAAFDTERRVVEEERRMGLNRPYGSIPEKLLPQIFTSHPYRWSPIGRIAHLRAAGVEELGEFWGRYYVPNNAALIVVGDVRREEVQALAMRYFGWMPRASDPPKVDVVEPPLQDPKSIALDDRAAPLTVVGVGFRTVPIGHADGVALEMLSTILGGGLGGGVQALAAGSPLGGASSRLYRDLVADSQLALFAIAGALSLEQDGLFVAGAALPPIGGKPDEVLRRIEAQLERLRSEPASDEEIEKARNQWLKSMTAGALTVDGKARMLGESLVLAGDADLVNRQADRIRSLTADELMKVAQSRLAPNQAYKVVVRQNLVGAVLGGLARSGDEESSPVAPPSASASPQANPKNLDRPASLPAAPPVARKPLPSLGRPATKHTLANGLVVRVVEIPNAPLTSATLAFPAGAWADSKPGVASMTFAMLTRGSQQFSEKELAEELERYAIDLSSSADMDGGSVAFTSLPEHFDRAVELAAEVVRRPAFPPGELEKLRKRTKASLALAAAQPDYAAQRELDRRLYGNHPYARPATGEIRDVDALDVDDCRRWRASFLRPDQATLVVAGAVSPDRAAELAERCFGDWSCEEPPPSPRVVEPPAASSTRIFLVDRPGAIQSQIAMGRIGVRRTDPAYPVSRVVTGYFGGAFNSRLNDAIRVQRGLTYGARGGFVPRRFAGAFNVATFTKTETTAETVRVALNEIDRLRTDPPTPKELQDTKSYALGAFVRDRETPQQVAADWTLIAQEDLPEDHFDRLLAGIERAGEGDCVRFAADVLDPTKLVVVVVGDAKRILDDLATIAPVTLATRDEDSQTDENP